MSLCDIIRVLKSAWVWWRYFWELRPSKSSSPCPRAKHIDSPEDWSGKFSLLIFHFTVKEENTSLEILDSGDPDLEKDRTKQFYIHQSLAPVHQAYFTDE